MSYLKAHVHGVYRSMSYDNSHKPSYVCNPLTPLPQNQPPMLACWVLLPLTFVIISQKKIMMFVFLSVSMTWRTFLECNTLSMQRIAIANTPNSFWFLIKARAYIEISHIEDPKPRIVCCHWKRCCPEFHAVLIWYHRRDNKHTLMKITIVLHSNYTLIV